MKSFRQRRKKNGMKTGKKFASKSEQLITEIITVGTAIYLGTSSSKRRENVLERMFIYLN